MYKFRDINGLEDFLLENVGIELLIPSCEQNTVAFFHNGDKMTINIATGMMVWEPIRPKEMFKSKLSLKLHQWFGKGVIVPVNEE